MATSHHFLSKKEMLFHTGNIFPTNFHLLKSVMTPLKFGTIYKPVLYKIAKTRPLPGKWFSTVTFIFVMNGKYFHARKNGLDRNDYMVMFMKCNNGAKCPWTGTLRIKDG